MPTRPLVRRLAISILAALPLLDGACAHDEVGSAGAVCGDGARQPEEECDVKSPGCVECREAPGYHCRDNVCTEVCGDGVVIGTETCDPPDGKSCDTACHEHAAKAEACDMTGAWLVHQTDYSVAAVINSIQTSSNWYYLEIAQTGPAFEVTKSVFCGITVSGSVDVKLSPAATKALLYRNRQDAKNPGGAHTGTFVEAGDGCAFEASRQYYVRGGKDALLPADFHASPELETLPPLPSSNDLYDPSKGGMLDLAEDTDQDGFLGVAYVVNGLVSGTRNVVQRDWSHYQSDATYPIAKFATELTARSDFRNQEKILHVECASGGMCPLLEAGSTPSLDTPGHVTLRYLGKTWNADPTQTVVVAEPGLSQEQDYQTCVNLQAAMPHEKGKK